MFGFICKKKRLKALLHIKPRQNYKTTLRNKTHFKILFNSFHYILKFYIMNHTSPQYFKIIKYFCKR